MKSIIQSSDRQPEISNITTNKYGKAVRHLITHFELNVFSPKFSGSLLLWAKLPIVYCTFVYFYIKRFSTHRRNYNTIAILETQLPFGKCEVLYRIKSLLFKQ